MGGPSDEHRRRGVDQEVDIKVFFLFKEAEEELFDPPIDVPIDVAKIIAAGVLAVIGKLDAAADFAGFAVGAVRACEGLAGDDVEILELGEEALVEEGASVVGARQIGGPGCHELTPSRAGARECRR